MATTTIHRLNLVIDEKMEVILAYFRSKYPLLKDSDLIKMAVSGFYINEIENLPVYHFNDKEDQDLEQSLQSKTSSQPSFKTASNLVDYLDN